ncbi:MAG TPA: DNA polymerase/3'-5' exonuclease PolX [Actinomycetota bacterium]|nr:DNA polymerase/3'-5' exonuclease PolX [Actinomycetota bacterium]
MPPTNAEVAAALHELADLLEIEGGDRFRILAYRRAGDAVAVLGRSVSGIPEAQLVEVHGIGKATAGRIAELVSTGRMRALDALRERFPPGVLEMTRLGGLGPKKALVLHRALGVTSLEELREAVDAGRLREVPGFGARSEDNVRRALERHARIEQRTPMGTALGLAEDLLRPIRQHPAVERAAYAGSLRRMRDTIGDLDILIATSDPAGVLRAFAGPGDGPFDSSLDTASEVIARGPAKVSLVSGSGLQVDLRVVAGDQFGSAMQYFTGSQAHNVKVREHAVRSGLKLSEYGLFRGAERIAGASEEEVYAALGMQTPLPTLREDRGEVELALRGALPRVVVLEDLRGDLQSHSTYSDGRRTLREMAMAAAAKGHQYYAVTDHGANLAVTRSLSLADIDAQAREVAEINEELGGRMVLLHGLEANIGLDGELDYPDEVLARFDVVVASLHHQLAMERPAMTRRVLKALRNPEVNIFGHPTGRMLPRRPASDFDIEQACRVAAEEGVAMEINSSPRRLDLKDEHVVIAREAGCVFAISTDAHSIGELDYLRFGVGTAQRGWVTPERVITTWPLGELRPFLAKA